MPRTSSSPPKETIMQHEIIARPWAKVGADLCDLHGRTLLVVCDYWSGFIEVERLQSTTTSAVSKALKVTFARYGVSNVLVTDNGPQFSSAEFLASYPGPSQKKGEGLVYTVCACAKIPQVFMGVRITPYLTVDYIRGLFMIVRFIAWVWLYGYGQSLRLFYRCRLRSF